MEKKEQLIKLVENSKIPDDVRAFLKSEIRDYIALKPQHVKNENNIAIGQTKFGGSPDLPPDIKIRDDLNPDLTFILQVNLAEISQFDINNRLPKSGMLYLFSGFMYRSNFAYYDGDMSLLRRDYDFNDKQIEPASVKFKIGWDLPGMESLFYSIFDDYDNIDEIYYSNMEDETKFFGHPQIIQNDYMAIQAESHYGKNPNIRSYRIIDDKDELIRIYKKWRLFFQLHEEMDIGLMLGDCGSQYYWISEEDLRNSNFDKIYHEFQCY